MTTFIDKLLQMLHLGLITEHSIHTQRVKTNEHTHANIPVFCMEVAEPRKNNQEGLIDWMS